jgi:hypothetical protein
MRVLFTFWLHSNIDCPPMQFCWSSWPTLTLGCGGGDVVVVGCGVPPPV